MSEHDDREMAVQLKLLRSPCGEAGSGMARYAAAMYFHRRQMLDSTALEIYRSLAKDDEADALSIVRALTCAISPVIAEAAHPDATK